MNLGENKITALTRVLALPHVDLVDACLVVFVVERIVIAGYDAGAVST